MKAKFKTVLFIKVISIIVSFILLFTVVTPALCAESVASGSNIPIVYVVGQGCDLYANKGTPEQKQIYPLTYSDTYIEDQAKAILPVFAKAVVTNNYDEYCDALYNSVAPLFEELKLDNNGESADSASNFSTGSVSNRIKNGTYDLFAYSFNYDWRIDPCDSADYLHQYIQSVLKATGTTRVNIVGRCLATNIVLAYLAEYGGELIDNCILYCGCVYGTTECGKLFSGQIDVSSEAAARYAVDYLDDDSLMEFVKASVMLLDETYAIDIAASAINAIYAKVCENLVSRLLFATYATMPSYWSMVGDADYENAKDFLFGSDPEAYDQLIDTIDYYHYNIQLKTKEIIEASQAQGTKVSVICKYGIQILPIMSTSDEISDGTVELSASSLGATCAKINGVLEDEAENSVFDKLIKKFTNESDNNYTQINPCNGCDHVSPDNQVDASTCLLPDNTWIIKNIEHRVFPESINNLMYTICNFDGHMTVNDNSDYPQFLVYNESDESISPMTEENIDTYKWNLNLIERIEYFFKSLFTLISDYFSKLGSENTAASGA